MSAYGFPLYCADARRNSKMVAQYCTCSLYAGPPEPPSECQVLNQTQAELAVECRLGYRKWQLEIGQTLLQNHLSTVSSV